MSAKFGIGRRVCSERFSPAVVGTRLVPVAQDHHVRAVIAHIGDIQHQVLGQLALHREVPGLNVAGGIVLGM